MRFKRAHCLFEQSGTFKNEFKKLGVPAWDYDILDDFGQTDYQMDLFTEIDKAYMGQMSVFDTFDQDDVVLAFFPCTRFESQAYLNIRGDNHSMKNWSDQRKLENDIKLHRELAELYDKVTKLAVVCLRGGYKLMIENPYSPHHYLVRYWAVPSTFIDRDRRERGDYFTKPTQYWFFNFKPAYNFIFEPQLIQPKKRITALVKDGGVNGKAERSLISPEYANRFIREFIL